MTQTDRYFRNGVKSMSKIGKSLLAAILILLWICANALAASGDQELPISIDAEVFDFSQGNNSITASGSVIIAYGNDVLKADQVLVDLSTGAVDARGNVSYSGGGTTITTSSIRFNYKTGRFESSKTSAVVGDYRLISESMTHSEGLITVFESLLAKCSLEQPCYGLYVKKVVIHPGNRVELFGPWLRIGRMNLLPLPNMTLNIDPGSISALPYLALGLNKEKGAWFELKTSSLLGQTGMTLGAGGIVTSKLGLSGYISLGRVYAQKTAAFLRISSASYKRSAPSPWVTVYALPEIVLDYTTPIAGSDSTRISFQSALGRYRDSGNTWSTSRASLSLSVSAGKIPDQFSSGSYLTGSYNFYTDFDGNGSRASALKIETGARYGFGFAELGAIYRYNKIDNQSGDSDRLLFDSNEDRNDLTLSLKLKSGEKLSLSAKMTYDLDEDKFLEPVYTLDYDMHCYTLAFEWDQAAKEARISFDLKR